MFKNGIDTDDNSELDHVPVSGNAMVDGYTKVAVEPGTSHCQEEVDERMQRIAPFSAEPVEGGFVNRNNIYERI